MDTVDLLSVSDGTYNPGDIILRIEQPLLQVTKYEHRLFICDHCMKKSTSSVICATCKKVYYCSEECLVAGRTLIHHLECGIFARHKPLQFETNGIDYMQRLTLRLYLHFTDQEKRQHRFTLHNGLRRTLDDMMYHGTELESSPQFQGILNYFKLYKIEPIEHNLLLRAYGILHVNSFGIDHYEPDGSIEHRGTGLYIEASVFDHSCVPNACAAGNGRVLEIRALSKIEPGDIIYIDYIQDVLPREERQKILEERYFFTCQCVGCKTGDFDSKVDFKRYTILNNCIETIRTKLAEDPNYRVNWHQLHSMYRQRLTLQDVYYSASGYHPCLSLFYRSYLQFVIVNQEKLQFAIEDDFHDILMKAKQHVAITHGTGHPFYETLRDRS